MRRFLSGKRGVYFVVSRLGNTLQELSEAIGEQLDVHPPLLRRYSDLFSYIVKESGGERIIFVIDEFQRLAEYDPPSSQNYRWLGMSFSATPRFSSC